MNDYILLMHNNGKATNPDKWAAYIAGLKQLGNFEGGSAIGGGISLSKSNNSQTITEHLSGYMRIKANNIEHAQELVKGNPVFEAGGTIEIRELLKS